MAEERDIFETPGPNNEPSPREMIREMWRWQREEGRKIFIALYGRDLNNPGDGMIARLKALEDSEASRKKLMWAAMTAAAGAFGVTVWNKISGGGGP